MPTPLEIAVDTMIRIFHHCSCKEGDRFKLNKGELKMLLQRELTEFLSCTKDPEVVDKLMQDLDANKDNEVDFNEFMVMMAALTVACNDYFVEQLKKKGKTSSKLIQRQKCSHRNMFTYCSSIPSRSIVIVMPFIDIIHM
ncbi:protein S100-Z [Hippopotamus amphibius kiboko]|uniref:protein S100-Z n=1 Tax=Hippopotamus amphibius kiboko TaxID=575201 RepID=UPI002593BD2D|nr:protein S100-Z [Hippopotamus amphibius kiboko]